MFKLLKLKLETIRQRRQIEALELRLRAQTERANFFSREAFMARDIIREIKHV